MIDDQDYLFILKNDDIETLAEIKEDLWLREDGIISLKWDDNFDFSHYEVKILANFRDKLCYAFASYYDDPTIIALIKKIIPDVTDIELSYSRHASGQNIREWQKQFNFTLEDFLTNKKYVVISDCDDTILTLIDDGLFNWDNIAEATIE